MKLSNVLKPLISIICPMQNMHNSNKGKIKAVAVFQSLNFLHSAITSFSL